MTSARPTTRRRPGVGGWRVTLVVGATYGLGLIAGSPPARSIGALCNGKPASDPTLDASYQLGPALLEGTPGDDVIIDSQGGHERVMGIGPGNFTFVGGPLGHNRSMNRGGRGLVVRPPAAPVVSIGWSQAG